MFLIAPGTHELASWDGADCRTNEREKQIQKVISQRRFRRRKSGMNTTQESRMTSSIFIGRWTPRILFSLGDKPYRHGQLRHALGGVSRAC